MGSGKSHWGKIWAEINQLSFIDLDEIIEKREGKAIADIFETQGEEYFRKAEAAVLRSCAEFQNCLVACGGGTPCFHENMQWINNHGRSVYMEASAAEILERVFAEKEKRPLIKNLSREAMLLFIRQKLAERTPFYNQANLTINSGLLNMHSFPEILSGIY